MKISNVYFKRYETGEIIAPGEIYIPDETGEKQNSGISSKDSGAGMGKTAPSTASMSLSMLKKYAEKIGLNPSGLKKTELIAAIKLAEYGENEGC